MGDEHTNALRARLVELAGMALPASLPVLVAAADAAAGQGNRGGGVPGTGGDTYVPAAATFSDEGMLTEIQTGLEEYARGEFVSWDALREEISERVS